MFYNINMHKIEDKLISMIKRGNNLEMSLSEYKKFHKEIFKDSIENITDPDKYYVFFGYPKYTYGGKEYTIKIYA